MATFRVAWGSEGSASSFSVNKGTGVVQDDVQLVEISADGSGHTLGISGGAAWTQIGSTTSVTNGDTQTVAYFRQKAGASEPASYTVTVSGGSECSVTGVAYSGVDTTTALAATGTINNPNSASPPASPVTLTALGITTTAANQTVVWFGTCDWNSSTACTFTDPSTFTRRAARTPAQFSNGLIADKVFTSAGATGNITGVSTLATQVGNFVALMVALNDAGGGGPDTSLSFSSGFAKRRTFRPRPYAPGNTR